MGSPLLAEDLARTVATAALQVFRNTTTTRQGHTRAGAGHVGEIAAAAGTSARAL